MCAGASEIGSGAASPNEEIVRTVLPFTTSVTHELKVLEDLQVVLGRQNTLKPIFAQFLGFRWTSYHDRRNALQLRKYLVDAFVDYDMLQTAWSQVSVLYVDSKSRFLISADIEHLNFLQGKEALEELLNDKLSSDDITDKQREEILKLLIEHFERPAGELPKRPKGRFTRRSSKKSSPSSTKSSSKDSPKSSEKSETDTDLTTLTNGIEIVTLENTTSLPTNPPAVEVNWCINYPHLFPFIKNIFHVQYFSLPFFIILCRYLPSFVFVFSFFDSWKNW